MNAPVTVRIGFDETPISEDRQVLLRAFRFVVGAHVGPAGGTIAFARPVAVIDRRGGVQNIRPVIDPTLILSAASVALALLALARRRRRGQKVAPPDKGG